MNDAKNNYILTLSIPYKAIIFANNILAGNISSIKQPLSNLQNIRDNWLNPEVQNYCSHLEWIKSESVVWKMYKTVSYIHQ